MSKQLIKQTIDDNIYQNGQQRITGIVMNAVLNDMVDDEYSELNKLATQVDNFEETDNYVSPLKGRGGSSSGDIVLNLDNYPSHQATIATNSATIVDLSSISEEQGYVSASNTWRMFNYYVRAFEVSPNTEVTIVVGTRRCDYFFLQSYSTPIEGASVPLCDGETGKHSINANTTETFTTPSDCNYIAIYTKTEGTATMPSSVTIGTRSVVWKTWGGYRMVEIETIEQRRFRITASTRPSRYAFLKSLETIVADTTPNFADGFESWVTINANQSQDVDTPSDATILIIQTLADSNNNSPREVLQYGTSEEYNIIDDIKAVVPIDNKQDNLVSGQNIKTINNQSILGGGNISIQGGGDYASNTIDNDLKCNGFETLPSGAVVKNNSNVVDSSQYGQDNAIYQIPIPAFNKLHLFVKMRFNDKIPVGDYQQILSLAGLPLQMTNKVHSASIDGGIYPRFSWGVNNSSIVAYGEKYNNLVGNTAFSVRWIGNVSDVTNQDIVMVMSDTSIVIKHTNGATIHDVSVTTDESMLSVVNKLKAFTDLEVEAYEIVGQSYGDLMYDGAVDIPLVSKFTKDLDGGEYWDNPYFYIPIALDKNVHTIEAIIDTSVSPKTFSVAFDGRTYSGTSTRTFTNTIILGAASKKITWYDLHIGIDSYEDAEVVVDTSLSSSKKQLISNNNPRLIIWEGHGVFKGADGDQGVGSMDVTTDRLYATFEALSRKGYVPVSWKDIIDWKINNKPLPKRCYNIMMDDWQIENFIDTTKRKPFARYNVKPGLAVIESTHPRTDNVVIDGMEYTAGECYDAIVREGWYPCSHAKHKTLGDQIVSKMPSLWRDFSITDNKLGIYSDVLVNPRGSFKYTIPSLHNSPFKIAVNIAPTDYVCKATSNFFLGRDEIGSTRQTWEKILANII